MPTKQYFSIAYNVKLLYLLVVQPDFKPSNLFNHWYLRYSVTNYINSFHNIVLYSKRMFTPKFCAYLCRLIKTLFIFNLLCILIWFLMVHITYLHQIMHVVSRLNIVCIVHAGLKQLCFNLFLVDVYSYVSFETIWSICRICQFICIYVRFYYCGCSK